MRAEEKQRKHMLQGQPISLNFPEPLFCFSLFDCEGHILLKTSCTWAGNQPKAVVFEVFLAMLLSTSDVTCLCSQFSRVWAR